MKVRVTPDVGEKVEMAAVLTRESIDDAYSEASGRDSSVVSTTGTLVDDVESSVPLFNAVDHGLVSYVYTRDLARGMRIAGALETGMVGLNRGLVSDPAAPFGGVKQSGIGREGAHEGLLEFCETKYVSTEW